MKTSPRLALLALPALMVAGGLIFSLARPAEAGPMEDALAKGKKLFEQSWTAGGKSCAACHSRGRNKLVGSRINAYPKYDRALKKVVTVQQKLNQMIVSKSRGKAMPLGSDDLNALEAYLNTLK